MRLWADVPDEERMTAEDYGRCGGGDDREWLARMVSRLDVTGCHAATAMYGWERKWHPCGMAVNEGCFCPKHGGPKREAVKRVSHRDRQIARLEREYARLRDRRHAMRDDMREIARWITQLKEAA